MIAETIRQLQQAKWYGCGETTELAKGKNAIAKDWGQAKEKIVRRRHVEALTTKKENKNLLKKLKSWLLLKKS